MTPTMGVDIANVLRIKRLQDIMSGRTPPFLPGPPINATPPASVMTPQAPNPSVLAPRPTAPQPLEPGNVGPVQEGAPDIVRQPPTVIDPDTLGPAPEIQGQAQIWEPAKPKVQPIAQGLPSSMGPTAPVAPRPPLAPPSPATDRLRELISQQQTQQQYEQQHPVSRFRHIMSIIGGIAAGIGARDPMSGMNMYDRLQHGRYYGDLEKQQAEIGKVKSIAEIEAAQRKAQLESYKTETEMDEKRALAEQQRANAAKLGKETENIRTFEQEKELEGIRHPEKPEKEITAGPFSVMLKNGSELQGVVSRNGKLYHGDAEVPDDQVLDSHKMGEPASPFRLAARAIMAQRAREGKPFTEKDVQLAVERSKASPNITNVMIQQERLNKLRAENRVMSPSDKLTENIVNELISNPGKASDKNYINPTNRAVVETRYREKTGHGLAIKDTPNIHNREANAVLVEKQLDRIDQIFRDYPELRARVGPLLGNLGKAESMVGTTLLTNFTNDPKREAEIESAAQEMRSSFRQLALTTAMSEGGGRFGKYLVQATEKMTPDSHMDWNMIQGGLNTARQFNEHTVKNMIGQERFGPNWLPAGDGYDTVRDPRLGSIPLHTTAADGSRWYYDMDKRKYMPMTTE